MIGPYDSVQDLRTYAMQNHLPQGKTAEETVNLILEDLAKKPENKLDGKYRSELISNASLVLMGIGRIKDPVRLYKNLIRAFERRGSCIFTNTVRNALIRLQNSAIEQGKEEGIITVWSYSNNFQIKETLTNRFNIKFLEARAEKLNSEAVYLSLFTNKDFTKRRFLKELDGFGGEKRPSKDCALMTALNSRKDFTKQDLFAILRMFSVSRNQPYTWFRDSMAYYLLQKRLTSDEFKKLLKLAGSSVIPIAAGLIEKRKLTQDEVETNLTRKEREELKAQLKRIIPFEKRESSLAHIKGSRGKRRKTMLRMTKPLRA